MRDLAPPYQVHSETSRAAAEAAESWAATARARVFECIRRAGRKGRTDREIQCELGMDGSTERPRRGELAELELIVRSGEKRKAPDGKGRAGDVWVVAKVQLELL